MTKDEIIQYLINKLTPNYIIELKIKMEEGNVYGEFYRFAEEIINFTEQSNNEPHNEPTVPATAPHNINDSVTIGIY